MKFGGYIIASETKHLMVVIEKFLDDGATDEASGSCYKDRHFV